MAFETFTAILNAASFPFVSDLFPRSIIVPGMDNPVRTPKQYYGNDESANFELAQQYYCQNVMPTAEGVMSIGYSQVISALSGATDFDQVVVLRDTDENNFLFVPAGGKNYIYTANRGSWQSTNPIAAPNAIVTRSYVNGRTFVAYEGIGVFEYDTAAGTFNAVAFTGLPAAIATIDGVSASNNYNICWSGITIAWSSLIDPTDFTSSITTGAGYAIPQDVKGPIRAVVPISGGFVAYTTKNAVAALYTNNARAPFVFKEISNAGGVDSPEQVSIDAALGYHYAYTTAGMQKITVNGAEFVDASLSDFLAGKILETFDIPTLTWTVEKLTDVAKVKVAFISGRYLVISYGKVSTPQLYTHAVVLDTALNRWGKLRIDHKDAFAYPYPNIIGEVTIAPPKQSVGFLQSDGTIQLLVMDYSEMQDQGVFLLGKYQIVRQKMVTFQYMELENLIQAYPPDVYLITSLDGRNFDTPQALTVLYDAGNVKKYGAPPPDADGNIVRRTGRNFSALVVGTFELSTALFTVTKAGSR